MKEENYDSLSLSPYFPETPGQFPDLNAALPSDKSGKSASGTNDVAPWTISYRFLKH